MTWTSFLLLLLLKTPGLFSYASHLPDTIPCPLGTSLVFHLPDTISCIHDTLILPLQDTTAVAGDTIVVQLSDTLVLKKDTLMVIGVGDIMLGTDYPSPRYLPPDQDCWPLLSQVARWITEADLAVGNLEGTFAGLAGKPKACKDTAICYVFRMPAHFVSCLVEAGFDIMSVANNHSADFGPEGRAETEKVLAESGLAYAGFDHIPSVVIEKDGLRYGFCAFSTSAGTPLIQDLEGARRIVSELDTSCDIVVVSFHGGAEGKDHQHVPRQTEFFLGYDRGDVYAFARAVIDAGADIVFGHGPHVTRSVDLYRDRFIIYSLGNFSTYARFNLRGPNGYAPLMQVLVDHTGKFIQARIIPIYQPGSGGAVPDPYNRAVIKLQELLKTDFPDAPLIIQDDGVIRKPGEE